MDAGDGVWVERIYKYRWQLVTFFLGIVFISVAIYLSSGVLFSQTKVEILSDTEGVQEPSRIVVEVTGAVELPGVYEMELGARVEELLQRAGGLSSEADAGWIEKNINRAAKLTDGQKLFIAKIGQEVSGVAVGESSSDVVNINTASLTDLDKLPGIGPVYGQKIIDQRPYSSLDELVKKGVLSQSLFEKIKSSISVY